MLPVQLITRQPDHANWCQELTEQCSGFAGLELIGDLVLLLTKAEGLIAIEHYLTDTATGDDVRVGESAGEGLRKRRSYRLVPPRSSARKVLGIYGDGENVCVRQGFTGRRITDPFSLPDGTPVTKVGLDYGVRGEGAKFVDIIRADVHDCHRLSILCETVSNLLEELGGYPREGDIIELELDLDCVEDLTGGVWTRV